jgi:hypothetical protein
MDASGSFVNCHVPVHEPALRPITTDRNINFTGCTGTVLPVDNNRFIIDCHGMLQLPDVQLSTEKNSSGLNSVRSVPYIRPKSAEKM